ncbi:ADP-ribosylation factor-like protein 15 isoform X8 [Pelodiscus sinensis]|uniref:ADP-ribosylation factor-like protein 15 isoform X8 n=1 Tax=Pelodiscus sinensis TaxID=13735 RepID=UPI003F6D2328
MDYLDLRIFIHCTLHPEEEDTDNCHCFWKLCFRALCCKGPPPPRPEYDLVCIGLTGSGKTSLLSQLCSESPENIVPTTGADTIRKYWSRYYQGSQGVIFVLDSASSEDDLETARNELHSALQHPQLCILPFLILANHQDKPAARSVQEFDMTGSSGFRGCGSCRGSMPTSDNHSSCIKCLGEVNLFQKCLHCSNLTEWARCE